MIYTWEDLQVFNDPYALIRKRPEMFIREVSGPELAERIAGDALRLTGGPVTMLRTGPWWVIAAQTDWLAKEPESSVEDLFSRPVPFPQAGDNSIRGEVVLAAFADPLVTYTRELGQVIKGKVPKDEPIWGLLKSNPDWKRVVAFCLPEKAKKQCKS